MGKFVQHGRVINNNREQAQKYDHDFKYDQGEQVLFINGIILNNDRNDTGGPIPNNNDKASATNTTMKEVYWVIYVRFHTETIRYMPSFRISQLRSLCCVS